MKKRIVAIFLIAIAVIFSLFTISAISNRGYSVSPCDAIDISLENATVTDFLNATNMTTVQVYNFKGYKGENTWMVQWSSLNRSLDVHFNVATGDIVGIEEQTDFSTTPVVSIPKKKAGCDMCHKTESTADLNVHVTGGLLVVGKPGCYNYWGCHGVVNASVHTIHPPEVECAACHGYEETFTIPPKGPGGTTCEQCHGFPNSLEPSEGNLVWIHLDRGKDCTVCHIGGISEIHGLE